MSYVITLGDEDGMKKNKIVSPAGIGMNINENKRKKELMLHFAGPAVNEIFDTLDDTEQESDYKTAVEKLTAYFAPQTNIAYKVYNFIQGLQFQTSQTETGRIVRQLSYPT